MTRARILFLSTFALLLASPFHRLGDSRYSMVLSQALLERGTFALENYVSDPNDGATRFERVNGHLYYIFPPGTSVLSVPALAVAHAFGVVPVTRDGRYDIEAETRLQAVLAALLMAGYAVIVFHTASELLPAGWALAIVVGTIFGSPVWSTMSRSLWSDTWSTFLLGWIIFLLVRLDRRGARVNPILLATLLSWTYFIRPTNAPGILLISAYVLAFRRRLLVPYALTGAVWLGVFVAYSESQFGRPLPTYYHPGRLAFEHFGTALRANLVSPSRGLLVFVPTLFFVGALVVCYGRRLPHRRLVALAVGVLVVHTILISGYWQWWAGHSYGPRFMANLVPWLCLLSILGVRAMLGGWKENPPSSVARRLVHTAGAVLLLLSVLVNARGALSEGSEVWNRRPVDIDTQPLRVFDWKDPQFWPFSPAQPGS
jgi:hypothetical protein